MSIACNLGNVREFQVRSMFFNETNKPPFCRDYPVLAYDADPVVIVASDVAPVESATCTAYIRNFPSTEYGTVHARVVGGAKEGHYIVKMGETPNRPYILVPADMCKLRSEVQYIPTVDRFDLV